MTRATIQDVAKLAGVSPSSVSRSLRSKGGVSGATAKRILEAAEQLGYTVSPAAHRLATGRTGTIAVVVPYLTRWFFAELLGGAEEVIRRAGLDLLLYHIGDSEIRQAYFSSGILRKRVDGVLLVTLALTEPEIAALRSLDVPICIVGSEVEGFSSISIDDFTSAKSAVEHLIGLGHERIAIIAGDPNEPMHFTVPLRRRAGYQAALEEAGIARDPRLEAHGAFSVEGGEEATYALLANRELPSAIFAECDEIAFGVLRVLGQVGIRVPEDISVIGFDDHPMASYFGLTTMRQEVAAQGRAIAEELVRAASDGSGDWPVRLSAETRLIVRRTTSIWRKGSPNCCRLEDSAGVSAQDQSYIGLSGLAPLRGGEPRPAETS
jgi:LacI family repressor for deo operon, udp, cdd, tsx, nupC, and nupG